MTEQVLKTAVSLKIHEYHLDRLAVVYVRQSQPQQLIDHPESTALQYALVDRAVGLGWPRDRVIVIDEDQAHSGTSIVDRLGFQRLLAEVSLDHVGLVLGLEMSRLARSNRDWHQLLEVCAMFRTLLADFDGVYDPMDYNDRLLLGLKGTISEAELHILKTRMREGLLNKARRGEVLNHPPIGYVRTPDDDYQFDPDEQAQHVTRLVFDAFDRQGSLHGLLRYLRDHHIQMPVRPHYGPNRGQLEWRRPNRATLLDILHHPIYAGAYRWGHREIDPRRQKPGRRWTGRTVKKPEECGVLIKNRFPAYITWERFEANQKRLSENRATSEAKGAPREGSSLLSGLLVCGRCGRRMGPAYSGSSNRLCYRCISAAANYGEPLCLGFAGRFLDDFVTRQVFKVLEPAALELSLAAEADLRAERERLHQHWKQRLERAAYEADRAQRQYAAVEPENRLVARELERRWESALQEKRKLEEEFDRFSCQQPRELSEQQREAIRRLSQDIPQLWTAKNTRVQERQEVVRMLLERVTVNIEGVSEHLDVTLQWAGGFTSCHRLVRPVGRYEQLTDYSRMRQFIVTLREQGYSAAAIAKRLNDQGFHPARRGTQFTGEMVANLLKKLVPHGPAGMDRPLQLENHEYWLIDLARRLNVNLGTFRRWQRMGWVHGRKVNVGRDRWVVWADPDEMARLGRLRDYDRGSEQCYPKDLTTPKPR